MLESISPYELLRASIPKSAARPATPYDLRCAEITVKTAESEMPDNSHPFPETHSEASHQLNRAIPLRQPHAQTRYIAEIHQRHNSASQKVFVP